MDRYVPILFIASCVWSLQLPVRSAETSHWAFVAPAFPSLPEVARTDWCRNEIDPFVLAKLESAGNHAVGGGDAGNIDSTCVARFVWVAPDADGNRSFPRVTIIRMRTSGWLIAHLPVHTLARTWHASGSTWARYGDTNGYQDDSTREVWLWRDWVMDAYNENVPFDQFTIEQLAGDLIPSATVQQRVASGFNRNTRFNEEGGSDPAEWRIQYAKGSHQYAGAGLAGNLSGMC